ncbi:MAG: hypothetical protein AB7I04_16130 [Pseudomonadales bacterium]
MANFTGATYRVSPSEDLSQVTVEVRLPPGRALPLMAPEGRLAAIDSLSRCDAGPVATRDNRILPGSDGDCVRYTYPLTGLTGRRSPPVAPGAVLSRPGDWLWTPEGPSGLPVRIEIALPGDMRASVPWKPVAPGVFELPPSPGSASAAAVFGTFRSLEVPVGGTRLRVAAVDGPDLRIDPDVVREWLATAAADVAGVGGTFPSPEVQVIVQPVRSRGNSPVPFGYVIRDGGEAVRFFVDPAGSLPALKADWTATHEFSHLLLPYVRSTEKWVSEGFASYYQNVLLARRGVYSEQEVWSRFHRAFVRAAGVEQPPALDELHRRDFREVRMLLYWSGAALALRADTRLRNTATGASLDTVLGRLADCCLPSARVWRADELFAKLDELAGAAVFTPLFEAQMRVRGLPDLDGLYADLGIEPVSDERVRLTGSGRLVAVRDAIMAPKD